MSSSEEETSPAKGQTFKAHIKDKEKQEETKIVQEVTELSQSTSSVKTITTAHLYAAILKIKEWMDDREKKRCIWMLDSLFKRLKFSSKIPSNFWTV